MSWIRLSGISFMLVLACAALARADDISAKKIFIKDNADGAKRQVQVQSADPSVQFSAAVDPATNGATLHLYSATDDFCVILAAGPNWVNKKNKLWKYKDKASKTSLQLKNGKLLIIIKSGVTYTLSDDGTQGAVNAQAQFGPGPRFCMRCTGNKKDEAKKFLGKDCAAAACDPEPSACGPVVSTTTTTIGGGNSTTSLQSGGSVLKGALAATPGRFNYNLTVGLPGANSGCNMNFAGTHACTYAELQSAQAAGDLDGLKDIGSNSVTSFWAIDSIQPALQQCNDDAVGGSGLNWEYATAHTASRGQKVTLDNAAGTLGPLQSSLQCNFSTAWVGCCQ
jgi:hypothetical protein